MQVRLLWLAQDWVEAVARLPIEGPLPSRAVLVPRSRVAHAVRRELASAGRSDLLAGTRFLTLGAAAVQVLRSAGVAFCPGEEALRGVRLLSLFRAGLSLSHFPLDLLRSKPGWDEAFAGTISDLEGAGLRPADLGGAGSPARVRDVAAAWQALDESAGPSWTRQRMLIEAAGALEKHREIWPYPGAILGIAGSDATAAEARFLRSIPEMTLGLLGSRPVRESYLERMEVLFGKGARETIRSAKAPRADGSERDLLASYVFEPPTVLADRGRARSKGPDGSVHLEEHAGVEDELEGTCAWVTRQIDDGVALERIAVLVPRLDPLAGLVADRLSRLPWHDGPLPVYIAGGLPLASFTSGARVLAVVRSLRVHLSAGSLSDLLPALRSAGEESSHLSRGAAMDLAWSLGTVGGNPGRPAGALEWSVRAAAREIELADQLTRAQEDEKEGRAPARRSKDIERILADLRAILPALDALVGLARRFLEDVPLAILWPALSAFLEEWLLQPPGGPRAEIVLAGSIGPLAAEKACGRAEGDDALRLIEEAILEARVPAGRFGEPAVYIGTVREATGLAFEVVRMIGLAEGHFPSVRREDPVLPDGLRVDLNARGSKGRTHAPTAADRALEDLHALDIAIRSASRRVALSAPRLDTERSQREPSFVILEAAAALGRPNCVTGAPAATIPNLAALRRDGFAPSRLAAIEFRRRMPAGETAWQDGVAAGAFGLPDRWRGTRSLDLGRIGEIGAENEAGPMHGILGAAASALVIPGLTPGRPISPSALEALLGCPHAFLLSRLLGFDEPASAPPRREIGQPMYGALFHDVAARFYGENGSAFCGRKGSLERWLVMAAEVADKAFGEFLLQYPLVGEAVRTQQRERLRRDVKELVEYDWAFEAKRNFVDVERAFGQPEPVRLPAGALPLYVRGRIDRIDSEGRVSVVRDLKTGGAHPRVGKEADPDPVRDIQIAVYGFAIQRLAEQWKVPKQVAAAYVYVGRGDCTERSFREDFHETLEPQAKHWLKVAAGLLAGGLFPRTPNSGDCTYCSFRPVCEVDACERAAVLLAGAGGVLADFAALKGAGPDEEED